MLPRWEALNWRAAFLFFSLFVDGKVAFNLFSFKVGRLLAREGGNCEEVVSSPEKIILHFVHVLVY